MSLSPKSARSRRTAILGTLVALLLLLSVAPATANAAEAPVIIPVQSPEAALLGELSRACRDLDCPPTVQRLLQMPGPLPSFCRAIDTRLGTGGGGAPTPLARQLNYLLFLLNHSCSQIPPR